MSEVPEDIVISDADVQFRFSRSAGPGGQNVNKLNTRVELLFDVENSTSLDQQQKERVLRKLKNRIDKKGILRVVCQESRSQKANQQTAIERLQELLKTALTRKRRRIRTAVPRAAKLKRLQDKRHRSQIKQQRSRKIDAEQ